MLTKAEAHVLEAYRPAWCGVDSGWGGAAHDDARAFCGSRPRGDDGAALRLCPPSAYCPNGPIDAKPLYMQMDAFEGVQWAPVSTHDNSWIMVGKFNEHSPMTCHSYLEIHQKEPDWGLDGTSSELKKHILCCEENSDDDGDLLDVDGEAQTKPGGDDGDDGDDEGDKLTDMAIGIHKADIDTSGGSNNADTAGQQPGDNDGSSSTAALEAETNNTHEQPSSSMTASETKIQDAHRPAWFSNEFGWRGTTHEDAGAFCESIPHGADGTLRLCPLEAYCPNGPRDIEQLYLQMDAFDGVQWAPYAATPIGDEAPEDNAWLMVGNVDDGRLTCRTYPEINHHEPAWGLDGSSTQLKEHILCCEDNSGGENVDAQVTMATPADGGGDAGDKLAVMAVGIQKQEADDSKASSNSFSNSDSGDVGDSSVPISSQELAGGNDQASFGNSLTEWDMKTQEAYNPAWFSNLTGWHGTTYEDAIAFCESIPLGEDGGMLHLCPLEAYCPNGPRDTEQLYLQMDAFDGVHWAPYVAHGDEAPMDNAWLMVGDIDDGHLACATYHDINHRDPSWGLDGSSPQLKEHILCCEDNTGNYDGGGVSKVDAAQDQFTTSDGGGSDDAGDNLDMAEQQGADSSASSNNFSNSDSSEVGDSSMPIHSQEVAGFDKASFENSVTNTFNPVWFDNNRGGWGGGSHDDAISFCKQFAGSHSKRMELCPYAACEYLVWVIS